MFLAIALNVYIYFLFKKLYNLRLDFFIDGVLTKIALYAIFVAFCFLLESIYPYYASFLLIFFGLEDFFILSSWLNNSDYFWHNNGQNTNPNPSQPPQNNSNSNFFAFRENNHNSEDGQQNSYPPETDYHRLGRDLITDLNKVIVGRCEMQERYPGTIASRSVSVDELNITRSNHRGLLIRRFAEDYLLQPDKNPHIERFCRSFTNPGSSFKEISIYSTSSKPNHRVMETRVIDAITHYNPR